MFVYFRLVLSLFAVVAICACGFALSISFGLIGDRGLCAMLWLLY